MIDLKSLILSIGTETCKSIALFHVSLTGCDTTSAFKFKGKRTCWNVLKKSNKFDFIDEFSSIVQNPF